MTKKHYTLIAAIFANKLREPYPQSESRTACLHDVAKELCVVFKGENSAFDKDQFMTACGFKE